MQRDQFPTWCLMLLWMLELELGVFICAPAPSHTPPATIIALHSHAPEMKACHWYSPRRFALPGEGLSHEYSLRPRSQSLHFAVEQACRIFPLTAASAPPTDRHDSRYSPIRD